MSERIRIPFYDTKFIYDATPSDGISTFKTISNAPTVDKLNGPSYGIGGSVILGPDIGITGGGDLSLFSDAETYETYFSGSKTVGLKGAPLYPQSYMGVCRHLNNF